MSVEPSAVQVEAGLKRPLPQAEAGQVEEPPLKKQKVDEPVNETPVAAGAPPTAQAPAPAPAPAQNEPKAEDLPPAPPRSATELINTKYLSRAQSTQIRDEYKTKTPFNYAVLPDFFNDKFLEEVKRSLEEEDWLQKRNDHFTIEVTSYDLKGSPQDSIRELRLALYSEQFRDFLSSITGLNLLADEELTATLYKQGGHMLCQDPIEQDINTKRICYILSLTPKDWTKQDGSTLDLFATDKNGQPTVVTQVIVPTWNSLTFFELSSTTFYQISEVLANKENTSIVGYFHGAPLNRVPIYSEPALPTIPLALLPTQFRIHEWVNPEYLKKDVHRKLKLRFDKDYSLALNDFLLKDKYDIVYEALKNEHLPWVLIGPANRRHYSTLGRWGNESETNEILQFKLFFRSKPMISLVEAITGLSVWETNRGEVRQFRSGDYTLVRDNEHSYNGEGLDLHIGFQDGTWMDDDGGYTTYLDAEDELLTLVPSANTLSLVLRESGTMRFIKYIGASAPAPRYDYQNSFVLASKDDDEGEDYAVDEDEEYVSEEDIEDVDENADDTARPPPRGGGGGGGDYDDDDFDDDGDDGYY